MFKFHSCRNGTPSKHLAHLLFLWMGLLSAPASLACSGYKVTLGNRTLFGSNHDTWSTTPHLWFETAPPGQYGAAFTGSRYDGSNGYAPQSGMNEKGLAFERLAAYHPQQGHFPDRKPITNPSQYLKDILHQCQSVAEVQAYIRQYDHSHFLEDVFMYVDRSGQYLVVEPYVLTLGAAPSYVLANFCPSITPTTTALQQDRYRNGLAFLQRDLDTTLAFGTAMLEAMHVCRNKIGDGTLLSTLWDLQNGTVNLFFYHDFTHTVQFNLAEALRQGNQLIAVETLFPPNREFERLRAFKTPKNSLWMGIFIVFAALLFLASAGFFLLQAHRNRNHKGQWYLPLGLVALNLLLFAYMIVLSGSVKVFYFSAPYQHPTQWWVSATSYLPFLLLALLPPLAWLNFRLFKEKRWSIPARWLFCLNNMTYVVLVVLFAYWKFYNIFIG